VALRWQGVTEAVGVQGDVYMRIIDKRLLNLDCFLTLEAEYTRRWPRTVSAEWGQSS
jgi:hypothetical protein